MVEGANRRKTPNEIALAVLLAGLTLVFLIAVVTLLGLGSYSKVRLDPIVLGALFICLIPTTIGGLLSAVGIAGMDRLLKVNVLATSGRAVEAAGDVRHPAARQDRHHHLRQPHGHRGHRRARRARSARPPRRGDVVPGRRDRRGPLDPRTWPEKATASSRPSRPAPTSIPFSATTRLSGLDAGESVWRKGSVEAIYRLVGLARPMRYPTEVVAAVDRISPRRRHAASPARRTAS